MTAEEDIVPLQCRSTIYQVREVEVILAPDLAIALGISRVSASGPSPNSATGP